MSTPQFYENTPPPNQRRLSAVLALASGFILSLPAFGGTAGTWYSIRTNGVPQSPTNLARGHSGDLWITSESNNEKGA